MKDYYQILGLEPTANEQEIKRAYFKLIRKYSPETDADKFQEIREAYEYLKSHPSDEFMLPLPENAFAKLMVQRVEEYIKCKQYEAAIQCCEEGANYFPEEFYFQYQMGKCQIYNGNTGNAIKTFQSMIKRYPQEKECVKGLAVAYYERGFYKKAVPYFMQAHQMGCNDIYFVIDYCSALNESAKYNEIIDIIFSFFKQEKYIAKNQMEEYLSLFVLLFRSMKQGKKSDCQKAITIFLRFLEQNRGSLQQHAAVIGYLLLSYSRAYGSYQEEQQDTLVKRLQEEISMLGLDKKALQQIDREISYQYLDKDPRIQEDIVRYLSIFFEPLDKFDDDDIRFAKVDAELCILDRSQKALCEFDIIQQEYPALFELVKEFVATLRRTNSLKYQKEKRLKEFNSKKMFYPSYYYKNNQQENDELWKKLEQELDEKDDKWDEFTPYVRTEKKVGRNDPCPCGSGLKYKKCCGR